MNIYGIEVQESKAFPPNMFGFIDENNLGPDRQLHGKEAFFLAKAAGIPTKINITEDGGKIIFTETFTAPIDVRVRNGKLVIFHL